MVEVVAAMAPVASQHSSRSCCCCVVSRTEQQHLGIFAAFLMERLVTVAEGLLLLSLSLPGISAVTEDLSLSSNLQCKDFGVDEADSNAHITEVQSMMHLQVDRSDLQVRSGEKEGIFEDSRISLIVKVRKDAEAPECKDDADSDDDDDDEDDDDDDEVDDDGDDDDAEEDDEGDAGDGQENNAEDEDDGDDDENGNEEEDDDDDDDDDEDEDADDDDDEDEDEDEEPPAKKKK